MQTLQSNETSVAVAAASGGVPAACIAPSAGGEMASLASYSRIDAVFRPHGPLTVSGRSRPSLAAVRESTFDPGCVKTPGSEFKSHSVARSEAIRSPDPGFLMRESAIRQRPADRVSSPKSFHTAWTLNRHHSRLTRLSLKPALNIVLLGKLPR